ncbi:MAG: cyclase [Desulfobacca sp.]|nr:cyclase [Desulfobacca sp.]
MIEQGAKEGPEFLRTDIVYHSHAEGAVDVEAILKVPAALLHNGEGWATETITHMSTHSVTHIDAPWHYNSRIQGERPLTIDELPLEWFFSDGVVLDMTHKTDGDGVGVSDVEKELTRIGYVLKPLDIVLIRTGRDVFYTQPDYMFRGCGVTAEATHFLFDQGVRVMGIDAWGWDVPLDRQAEKALKDGQPGIFWAAHQVDLPYAHIERLVNLGGLPAFGFKVSCFPLKIKGGSAGPARIVALVP